MADNRQAAPLFSLSWPETLHLLAHLSGDFAETAAGDLRFELGQEGTRVWLPHFNDKPNLDEALWRRLRNLLGAAYAKATGEQRDISRRAFVTQNLEPFGGLADAALAAFWMGTEPSDDRPHENNLLLVAPGPDSAERAAEAVKRGRHVSLAAADGSRLSAEGIALLKLSADSDDGATIDGVIAAQSGGAHFLAPNETSGGTLWLPRDRTLAASAEAAGSVLAALRPLLPEPDAQILLFGGAETGIVCALLPRQTDFVPAEEVLDSLPPLTPLTLQRIAPTPSAQALTGLAERIAGRGFPAGYRVALERIPDRLRPDNDVEQLREEIDEREAEIAMIEALNAPQMRLLRFTDAQLPAMIDGIRRLPPGLHLSDHLRYATGHSAGRSTPSHYLLYDPARVALEGHIPEYHWRLQSGDDSQIRFWLDPFAARGMDGTETEPLVFVPEGSYLSPPIDAFGARIDGTLRLMLGNLFADTEAVEAASKGRPVFLFTPADTPDFDMEIELVDENAFAPLHLRLRWLNDHLMVRSPRVADPERLSELAEDLYEGEAAKALSQSSEAAVAELEAARTSAAAALSAQVADLARGLADEVEQTGERLLMSLDFIAAAQTRIRKIDQLLNRFAKALNSSEAELAALAAQIAANSDADFVDRLVEEFARGRAVVAAADDRIETRRATLDAILSRADR